MSLEDENRFLRGIAEEQTKKIDDLKKTISSAVEAQNKLQKELDERNRTDKKGWEQALQHLNDIMEVIQTENHKLGEDNQKLHEELDLYKDELSIAHDEYAKLKDEKNKFKNQNEHLTTFSLLVGAIEESIDWDEWRHILENAGWIYDDKNEKYREEENEWWKPAYNSFEEAIVGEFGDQSEQAKKYGFGVFK